MEDIGFNKESVFSGTQVIILFVFIFLIWGISKYLKSKKGELATWFPSVKLNTELQFDTEIQKVDVKTYLYRFTDDKKVYLVLRTPDGVVLLDKQSKGEAERC